jgi:hypothetical protein
MYSWMSSSHCFEGSQCLHIQGQHSERNFLSVNVLLYMSLNLRIAKHMEMVISNSNVIKVHQMAHEDFLCYTV